MKKIAMVVLIVMIGVLAGCAMFQQNAGLIGYSAGQYGCKLYLDNQGSMTPEQQELIAKGWDYYKQFLDQTKSFDYDTFVSTANDYMEKIPNEALKAKVKAMADTCWTELNKRIDMKNLEQDQFIVCLASLRAGIQAQLDASQRTVFKDLKKIK